MEFNYQKMKKSTAKLLYSTGVVGDINVEVGIVGAYPGALQDRMQGRLPQEV